MSLDTLLSCAMLFDAFRYVSRIRMWSTTSSTWVGRWPFASLFLKAFLPAESLLPQSILPMRLV